MLLYVKKGEIMRVNKWGVKFYILKVLFVVDMQYVLCYNDFVGGHQILQKTNGREI